MARPLNVLKLLELKLQTIQFNGKFMFSVKDDIITENTGTYIMENNTIEKIKCNNENIIPYHVFSALLFGGIAMHDATLSDLIGFETTPEVKNFFTVNRNIYLSEYF